MSKINLEDRLIYMNLIMSKFKNVEYYMPIEVVKLMDRKWIKREVVPKMLKGNTGIIEKNKIVKLYNGRQIVTLRDFRIATGIDIKSQKLFFNPSYFTPGRDWNVVSKETIEKENNVHYQGQEWECILYNTGLIKVLKALFYGCCEIETEGAC